jgi:hypothetical protein
VKLRRAILSFSFVHLAVSAGMVFAQAGKHRFEVRFPSSLHSGPITGRVFVMITQDAGKEPRFQAGARYMGCPFYGVDIDQLKPGSTFPGQDAGYRLYQDWISDNFPRVIMVLWLHPTPYYDDSYAVNSANNGPYGDAIMQELVPYIESHFRIIRKPYARVLAGGSTGGWESLALQLYCPEFFGGAWIFYHDPIDFRR